MVDYKPASVSSVNKLNLLYGIQGRKNQKIRSILVHGFL